MCYVYIWWNHKLFFSSRCSVHACKKVSNDVDFRIFVLWCGDKVLLQYTHYVTLYHRRGSAHWRIWCEVWERPFNWQGGDGIWLWQTASYWQSAPWRSGEQTLFLFFNMYLFSDGTNDLESFWYFPSQSVVLLAVLFCCRYCIRPKDTTIQPLDMKFHWRVMENMFLSWSSLRFILTHQTRR